MENVVHKMVFVGSGLSCTYTLIHYLTFLKESPAKEKASILVIEKTGEFWTGIPYGKRSGTNSLIISSLREFLPEAELYLFIAWLKENKDWIFNDFKSQGGDLSKRWLNTNADSISSGKWDNLFVPRYIFGIFLKERVEKLISEAIADGSIDCTLVAAEVIDVEKLDGFYKITTADRHEISCEKVILCIGSPEKQIKQEFNSQTRLSRLLSVDNMYKPGVDANLNRINSFLDNADISKIDVLIIGSNASALETLYNLVDSNKIEDKIDKFYIISSNGTFPHRITDKGTGDFIPEILLSLSSSKSLTSKEIFEAVQKDVLIANEKQIEISETYAPINNILMNLLDKLDIYQQHQFVHKYGVEIGKLQRRVGDEYIDVVEYLQKKGKIEIIKGKVIIDPTGGISQYLDLVDKKLKDIPLSVKIAINCSGFQELSTTDSPILIQNLLKRNLCTINGSNRGVKANKDFEIYDNLFLIGPMLAGNVNESFRIWHAESCVRIFFLSQQLSKLLLQKEINTNMRNVTQVVSKVHYLIPIDEKEKWNQIVNESVVYDFYHTWYYHSLETTGQAVLFVYKTGNVFIALPLIKRSIDNSEYQDFTSVYGYAGPISNRSFETLDSDAILGFGDSLREVLAVENIVSVFSRLHPVINQHIVLDQLGGVIENGKTVAIDLRTSIEEQRLKYRRAIRQKVNQLRRKGYIVKEAETKEDVLSFVEIYNQNMVKVKASSYYYFTEQYFTEMLYSTEFESKLVLLYDNGTIAAGAVVTFSNNIMQFHLAATRNEYLSEAPMKLLIDESSLMGRELGMHYLHLGGGVGGKQDSLFEFKSGFSDLHLDFKTWRYIADEDVYNNLVAERVPHPDPENNFFPLYRSVNG